MIGRLRRAILAGSLPAGAPLSEREIAQQLGISRTPVREAFAALGGEGLLEISPHREVRVVELSPRQREEAGRLRALLEGYALQRAGQRARAALAATLWAVVDEFQALARRGLENADVEEALEQCWQSDMRFHAAIVRAAAPSTA